MFGRHGPVHRALLELVAASHDADAIARALDTLDRHPAPDGVQALRAEVREQLAAVRTAEPGAVKRLQHLLHLLVEAELRHMQAAAKVD